MNQFPHEYDDDSCCVHCNHDGAEEYHLRSMTHPDDRDDRCPDEVFAAAFTGSPGLGRKASYCPVRKNDTQTFFPNDDWDLE